MDADRDMVSAYRRMAAEARGTVTDPQIDSHPIDLANLLLRAAGVEVAERLLAEAMMRRVAWRVVAGS